MSILIYHAGGIGDFITTIPAISLWYKFNINKKRVFLGPKSTGTLGTECGLFDESYNIEKAEFSGLFTEKATPNAVKFLTAFDSALLFTSLDSPLIESLKKGRVKNVLIQPPFPSQQISKYTWHYSLMCTSLGIDSDLELKPLIDPPKNCVEKAKSALVKRNNVVAIHPGSGSKLKNWPLSRFIELSSSLKKNKYQTIWIVGPAEESITSRLEGKILANYSLALLSAILKQCSLFIGNDSGIAHLSGASGCPTIVLFGASNNIVWKPFGSWVHVLNSNRSCSPCHQNLVNRKNCNNECMNDISTDVVIKKSIQVLNNPQ